VENKRLEKNNVISNAINVCSNTSVQKTWNVISNVQSFFLKRINVKGVDIGLSLYKLRRQVGIQEA